MSKILFVTWPGGGNQPPAIGLAQQLRRDGHETLFAGYTDQATRFTLLDFDLVPFTRSGTTWEPFDPADLMPMLLKRAWACPDNVADTAEILDLYQPDLVVVDCLMGGVLAAMETSPIPTVVLVHSAPGALAPPGGPIDGFVIGELNRIRSALDLTPVDSYWQAWQQHNVICASIPELDPIGTDPQHPVTWIGPVFEDPTTTDWMPDDQDDTPLVLVSFNSGGAWDQTSRIQHTIDGLAGADLHVIVTAGMVDPSRLHAPTKSITIVPYIPHAAILPRASAVVTHVDTEPSPQPWRTASRSSRYRTRPPTNPPSPHRPHASGPVFTSTRKAPLRPPSPPQSAPCSTTPPTPQTLEPWATASTPTAISHMQSLSASSGIQVVVN